MQSDDPDSCDQSLRELLMRPCTPASLASRLHEDLAEQVAAESRRRWVFGVGTVAAVVLAAIIAWMAIPPRPTPPTIVAAYDDMVRDRVLRGTLDSGLPNWLSERGIAAPPERWRVDLSKDCQLDALRSKHLRLVTADAGTINVFLYVGPEAVTVEEERQGRFRDQRWLVLKPRPETLVIVLFERESARAQVAGLLQAMFATERFG